MWLQMMPGSEGQQFLDLGTMSSLDRQLRCLMDYVDDLSQEANKFNNFQRQNAKQLQDKHKFMQKRVRLIKRLFFIVTFTFNAIYSTKDEFLVWPDKIKNFRSHSDFDISLNVQERCKYWLPSMVKLLFVYSCN